MKHILQNLLCMLTQQRRWQAHTWLGLAVLDRDTDELDLAGLRVLHLLNHLARYHLRMRKRVCKVVDGCKRDTLPFECFQPMLVVVFLQPLRHNLDQLVTMLDTVAISSEPDVRREMLKSQYTAKSLELAIVATANHNARVASREGLVGHNRRVRRAPSVRLLAGNQIAAPNVAKRGKLRLQ